MDKYRKKPVVIEAAQLHAGNAQALSEQMVKDGYEVSTYSQPPMRAVSGLTIRTLEGDMIASYGDWIIKGVQGEYYPCKPDIFEKTYDKAEEENGE